MNKEFFKPDYSHSILNLMASILSNYGAKSNYSTLPEVDSLLEKKYNNVVLLILDGMGANVLNYASPDGLFSSYKISTVTSVFPCTTTAALTTYYSGKSPFETGWLAWSQYFKEYGRAIDMLPYVDSYTGESLPRNKFDVYELLQYKTVYEQILECSNKTSVYEIKPAHCDMKTDKCIHIHNLEGMCDSIKTLCRNTENKYIFSYFDSPDNLNHKYGWNSEETKEFILYAEKLINKLQEDLKNTNTLLLICADHGHNNIENNYSILEFEDLQECFIMPPSLEPRFLSFWIKEEKKEYFENKFKEKFFDEFILFSKKEFMDSNLLGFGKKHPKIDDFIGDYVAIAIANSAINLNTYLSKESYTKLSNHCGLTKNEMEVPLIAFDLK